MKILPEFKGRVTKGSKSGFRFIRVSVGSLYQYNCRNGDSIRYVVFCFCLPISYLVVHLFQWIISHLNHYCTLIQPSPYTGNGISLVTLIYKNPIANPLLSPSLTPLLLIHSRIQLLFLLLHQGALDHSNLSHCLTEII